MGITSKGTKGLEQEAHSMQPEQSDITEIYSDDKEDVIPKKYLDQILEDAENDITYAEDYFDLHIKPSIITRYQLLHSYTEYYRNRFPNLSKYTDFSTTDIKDAIESIMPSFLEVFFGADKMISIQGSTEDDDPEPLERLIEFQVTSLNDGYGIFSQWFRDPLEAGLGVLKATWVKRVEKVKKWVEVSAEQLEQGDAEQYLDVKDNKDGTYKVKIEATRKLKDQPVLTNIQPGCWIYSSDKDMDGISLFEAHRHYLQEDDLNRLEKEGFYSNVSEVDFMANVGLDSKQSIDDIAEAIAGYNGEQTDQTSDDEDTGIVNNRRNKVIVYECYGKYMCDESGLEQHCEIHIAGGVIVRAKKNVYQRPKFFDMYAFSKSYTRWKEAVADILCDIQDLRTALFRQVIINTAMNNDRKVALDISQKQALKDMQAGAKVIRVKLTGNQSIKDVMDYAPEHKLSGETMSVIEMLQGMSEQRTGVTRYNQGLDADSLNKTASGITKIMQASQQKLRMAARNESKAMVELYRFLVELNQRNFDEELVVRLTGKHYTVKPDDINGKFDVEITSNIGLQDSQLTTQNLMILFTQILPQMIQLGIASPMGAYMTASKMIREMGFKQPAELIGMTEDEIRQQAEQSDMLQQLPMMLAQLMKQAGMDPERSAAVVQGLMQAIQPQEEDGQPNQEPQQ